MEQSYGLRGDLAAVSVLAVSLVASLVLLSGCGQTESSGLSVEIARGEFIHTVSAMGELKAADTEVILAKTQGKIADIVPEGSVVEAGDPVFYMETEEIEESFNRAQLDLEMARANLEKAEETARLNDVKDTLSLREAESRVRYNVIGLEEAQKNYRRAQRLEKSEFIPAKDVEDARIREMQAQLDLDNAEINLEKVQREVESHDKTFQLDIDNASAEVDKAQNAYDEAVRRRDNAVGRATSGGIVVFKRNWRGEKVQIGDQVFQGFPIIEIPDLGTMEVELRVNEADMSVIRKGLAAQHTVDAFPDLEMKGHITEIAVLASERQNEKGEFMGIKTFDVVVSIEDAPDVLRPGMSVRSRILVDKKKDVLTVPLEALYEKDGEIVVLRGDGSRTEPQTIKISTRNQYVAVVEEGLEEGQRISLTPPDEALEGLRSYAEAEELLALAALEEKEDEASMSREDFRKKMMERGFGPPGGGDPSGWSKKMQGGRGEGDRGSMGRDDQGEGRGQGDTKQGDSEGKESKEQQRTERGKKDTSGTETQSSEGAERGSSKGGRGGGQGMKRR